MPCISDRDCSARGQVCNTASGRCVECNATTDCTTGQMCLANRCTIVTRCTSSRMCPGQVCSTSLGYCVDCDTDRDCPGGQVCRANACVPSAGACRTARDCSGATPVCDATRGQCVGCVVNTDCATGQVCQSNTCQRLVCMPGSVTCPMGEATRTICNADGLGTRSEPCTAPANATMARCGIDDACTFDCMSGFADCDMNPANGCEANLGSAANCGRCGVACPSGQSCVMGACAGSPTQYVVSSIAAGAAYVEACMAPGAMMVLAGTDDNQTRVPLPFDFHFWTTNLRAGTRINVTSNGLVEMNERTDNPIRGMIPDSNSPNSVIAPYWGDNQNVGAQCIAVVGAAPSRRWVLEWPDAYHCCGRPPPPPRLAFEVVLYESTNVIEFLYRLRDGAMPRTIGIENEVGSRAVSPCASMSTCIPTSDYRFVPVP